MTICFSTAASPGTEVSVTSSSVLASRTNLAQAKLLNVNTFETIDEGLTEGEDPSASPSAQKGFFLSTTASETVDSGIGADELVSDSTSLIGSKLLGGIRLEEELKGFSVSDKFGLHDYANNKFKTEVEKESNKDSKGSKVTLVTTRFACLSVSSPDGEESSKKVPLSSHLGTSPNQASSTGIFNMKLLKENVLRETEGLEPLQASPNLEDSSSTSSYLTISGSSGYFSKSGTTEPSGSTKVSPTNETDDSHIDGGSSHHPKLSFLKSFSTENEPTVEKKSAKTDDIPKEDEQSNVPFQMTRFSFITKDYLPSNAEEPSETNTEQQTDSSSLSSMTISNLLNGTSRSILDKSDKSTLDLEKSEPSRPRPKYFAFLNLGGSSTESLDQPSLFEDRDIDFDKNFSLTYGSFQNTLPFSRKEADVLSSRFGEGNVQLQQLCCSNVS